VSDTTDTPPTHLMHSGFARFVVTSPCTLLRILPAWEPDDPTTTELADESGSVRAVINRSAPWLGKTAHRFESR
jgi:hypothetical protein